MSYPAGAERRERLERARLYLVIESAPNGRPATEIVGPALEGGVDVVQLREKHAPAEEIAAVGGELVRLCHRHEALLVVNDRAEIAVACGADGVHVGQEDGDPEAARAVVGPELLLGVSTHTPEQIEAAERSSADYLGVGPVHATATKPDVPAVGLELVRHAASNALKPYFAIGGIDPDNAGEAVDAGALRIAVVRAIRDAPDPRQATEALLGALDRAHALAAR